MIHFSPTQKKIGPWLVMATMVLMMAWQLHRQGRVAWCECGQLFPWAGDIWSLHNSQHWFDPYSFTHVLHGMVFYGLLAWLFPRMPMLWNLSLAVLIEAMWEVMENSPLIIQRYRQATSSLGYEGDSIANSLADVLCCGLGFMLARRLGLRWSIIVFVATELALLLWVRDNLTLNILMLAYPIEAVKTWQMGP